jgi:hypothetical protein
MYETLALMSHKVAIFDVDNQVVGKDSNFSNGKAEIKPLNSIGSLISRGAL